uniref:Uncharacterized protein n=1 Tax=viral metagenome TaxID=1070528 RepID=A0A6M3KX26_9ZZZZ
MATKVFTDEFTDVNPMADDTYWLGSDTLGWKGVKFPDTKIYQVDADEIGIRTIADGGAWLNVAAGFGIKSAGAINFLASGDPDDYLSLTTVGNVVTLTATGSSFSFVGAASFSSTLTLAGALFIQGSASYANFQADAATAGATIKYSPTLYLQARYWDGAQSTNWSYEARHIMVTAGATPASYVYQSINSVEGYRMTNTNGTMSHLFTGIVTLTSINVGANQVIGARVVDERADDVVDATYGAEEAGVLDALRDAMIAHGLIASS